MNTIEIRANALTVPFENFYNLNEGDITRIGLKQVMKLRKGEVVLVRSSNVPENGDHFIIITGGLVHKPHGIRPMTEMVSAPNTKQLLDRYKPDEDGLILFHLCDEAQDAFFRYHKIQYCCGEVTVPETFKL